MVNTFKNANRGEFKKMTNYTWVDIDEKKKPYTFTEMTMKTSSCKQIIPEDASTTLLASSIYDLVKKQYP
jgi:hypothetical protein